MDCDCLRLCCDYRATASLCFSSFLACLFVGNGSRLLWRSAFANPLSSPPTFQQPDIFRNSLFSVALFHRHFSAPPDHSLKTIATPARPVLCREFASGRSVLHGRELPALWTRSTPRNPMRCRVMAFDVSRRFQWLHFQPFTNFSAFLPEITPFCGRFSAIFSARFCSNSNTECPTNAR